MIKYNMTNIFLEKSYTECGGETSPRPFSEKLKFWINSLRFYTVCFLLYVKLRAIKYVETKLQTVCFYPILSFFKKKEVSN